MIKREEIKYRVDRVKQDKYVTLLIYIDARAARRELNEKFGFGNWQFSYTVNEDKSVHGVLRVRQETDWLVFEDVGYCSNAFTKEPLKDAVSDATKRCAVQVGIGEELYDAPNLKVYWENLDAYGKQVYLKDHAKRDIESQIDAWYKGEDVSKNRAEMPQKEVKDVTQNIQPIEIDGVTWRWLEGVSKKTGKPYRGWGGGDSGWMSNSQMQVAKKKYEERVAKELDDTSLDDLPF
jgi:hypothetical protein